MRGPATLPCITTLAVCMTQQLFRVSPRWPYAWPSNSSVYHHVGRMRDPATLPCITTLAVCVAQQLFRVSPRWPYAWPSNSSVYHHVGRMHDPATLPCITTLAVCVAQCTSSSVLWQLFSNARVLLSKSLHPLLISQSL